MSVVAPKRRLSGSSKAVQSAVPQTAVRANGKEVRVSSLDKVLYPKTGFTKGQVIDYCIRIAPALLPHLKDRPITMKRYPNGVEGPFFYEKRCPTYRPDWVKTARVWSKQNEEDIHFCVIGDLATLIWAANLAALELHTYLAKKGKADCPTAMVFDLDPGPPAGILQCAEVALRLRGLLEQLRLKCFVKTSGSKGLQVYVPLNTATTFEATKEFARKAAELLSGQSPELVVSNMSKSVRMGKVFIDWSQNDSHKTTVCVYSLRAKEEPTVSTPVMWEEIENALRRKDAKRLRFGTEEALKRVEEHGDIFAPVLKLKQKVPKV